MLTKRQIWALTLALTALVLLALVAAPGGSALRQGSTYSRSPDGYGAWYALMQSRNVAIQRWQRPLKDLPTTGRSTLLTISHDREPWRSTAVIDWVRQGNVLIQMGMKSPVSRSPFRSQLTSPQGTVQIETSRRAPQMADTDRIWLSDEFGAVVWQERLGQGRIIYATTPFLAANAYQDEPGNFEFLAALVKEPGYPIWVDEYSHGYRDAAAIQQETTDTFWSYLAQRPIALVALQALVLLLVLVWGQNQRLGRPLKLTEPAVDNSAAYIQALADVLRKADASQFVLETIGRSEQLALQQRLGLGSELLPPEAVVAAWVQQTGRSGAELASVLNFSQSSRQFSESDLLRWLDQLRLVHRSLPGQQDAPPQNAISAVSSPATHV
jgi:hypothetical protein